MWQAPLPSVPPRVLACFSLPSASYTWVRVTGGLSGADVWRGADEQGNPHLALKCWPAGGTRARLEAIHQWMGLAARLPIMPLLLRTSAGTTVVEENGRLWDATYWKPGRPVENPGVVEVERACEAVATLHAAWSRLAVQSRCPGIIRRCDVLRQWREEPITPDFPIDKEAQELLMQARNCVVQLSSALFCELDHWQSKQMLVQPCIRDARREHILFEEGFVSGIIDYGAMDFDSPAIDLARLLGDLAAGRAELRKVGLKRYRECASGSDVNEELIALLERADIVCSLVGWLVRFSKGQIKQFTGDIKKRLIQLTIRASAY